ncbi:MAG TPA: sensor histidine kinase [Caulobacteraceae bacterium]|nr:sensor histidine kinase [Caulobacteraceae bacterium]
MPDRASGPWSPLLAGGVLGGFGWAAFFALRAPLGADLATVVVFPLLAAAAAAGGILGGLACLAVATIGGAALALTPGGPRPWGLGVAWVAAALTVLITAALADRVRRLRRGEVENAASRSQLQTLVGELAHRNRNALVVVMSIVSQSSRNAPTAAAAEALINARLSALLKAQEVVLRSTNRSASLRALLEEVLQPFEAERFAIGPAPDAEVEADLGVGLALVFHELATNALKHGALSRPEGRVTVGWTVDQDVVRLTWREAGGPIVTPPSTRGFGARLLEVALVPQGGKAERRFEPDGLVCDLLIPAPPNPAGVRSTTPLGAGFVGAAREASSTARS